MSFPKTEFLFANYLISINYQEFLSKKVKEVSFSIVEELTRAYKYRKRLANWLIRGSYQYVIWGTTKYQNSVKKFEMNSFDKMNNLKEIKNEPFFNWMSTGFAKEVASAKMVVSPREKSPRKHDVLKIKKSHFFEDSKSAPVQAALHAASSVAAVFFS